MIFAGLIFATNSVSAPTLVNPVLSDQIVIQGNSVKAVASIDMPIVNKQLIACLIYYESKENENAIGDHGTSFGCLQFKKDTFQEFCVEKYKFRDDIMNCGIQKSCADLMIRDGYAYKWTALKSCL